MSDEETPFMRGASAEAGAPTPGESETPAEEATGGKLIHADVFLSRLAERQEERDFSSGEASVVDAILGALESIGLDPNTIAPDFVKMARASALEVALSPAADSDQPSLEEMAVEELFLSELLAGRRPSLSAYMQRYSAQRDALLRLAISLEPRELAGLDAPGEMMTPEQEAAARAGQDEGTRRALREAPKRGSQRGRGAARRVAEERAPYTAGQPDETGEEKPKRGRARPARPDESGPER